MGINTWIDKLITREVAIAPLVTFRFVFGVIMFLSIMRFILNGWIESQYIYPAFHFKFFGFYWVPELPAAGYYIVFSILALTALGIAFGALYRISACVFFLLFTYIELVDATYYLNHYYFVSIVALLLIFIPANRQHALDVNWGLVTRRTTLPAIFQNIILFQLSLVYFLAGVAKINADWLLNAMPLAIWLPAQSDLPVVGQLLSYSATAYIFSWAGAIYDLTIPFFLVSKKWRIPAYIAVIGFHLITWKFFQIGMFPFIMIGSTLVFFSANFHQRLHGILKLHNLPNANLHSFKLSRLAKPALTLFVLLQLAIPFRNLLYPGNPFWTEQGYRFGWRVMLMEKAGYAQFKISDAYGKQLWVDNGDFLSPAQEKMMATQPDFMLQYAAYLKQYYLQQGIHVDKVTADVYVTFNGRASQAYIDPSTDLSSIKDSWSHKQWIKPLIDSSEG